MLTQHHGTPHTPVHTMPTLHAQIATCGQYQLATKPSTHLSCTVQQVHFAAATDFWKHDAAHVFIAATLHSHVTDQAVLGGTVPAVELPCAVDGEGLDAHGGADGATGVDELALLENAHSALTSLPVVGKEIDLKSTIDNHRRT